MNSVTTQPVCGMPNDEAFEIAEIRKDIDDLKEIVSDLKKIVYGDGGQFGLAQKIHVMWKAWVWVLCTLSAAAGYVAHAILPWFKP